MQTVFSVFFSFYHVQWVPSRATPSLRDQLNIDNICDCHCISINYTNPGLIILYYNQSNRMCSCLHFTKAQTAVSKQCICTIIVVHIRVVHVNCGKYTCCLCDLWYMHVLFMHYLQKPSYFYRRFLSFFKNLI